jgi:phosphoribosylformylglycinamidine synthase
MKFRAYVHILPRPEILDPQGKATLHGLHNLGFDGMQEVRVGKLIQLDVEADDEAAARTQVESACKKVLSNPIVEQFRFELAAV